ncbi:MAG: hypothetical protein WCW14_01320 [Candidatus Paceibacterota bacterium]
MSNAEVIKDLGMYGVKVSGEEVPGIVAYVQESLGVDPSGKAIFSGMVACRVDASKIHSAKWFSDGTPIEGQWGIGEFEPPRGSSPLPAAA